MHKLDILSNMLSKGHTKQEILGYNKNQSSIKTVSQKPKEKTLSDKDKLKRTLLGLGIAGGAVGAGAALGLLAAKGRVGRIRFLYNFLRRPLWRGVKPLSRKKAIKEAIKASKAKSLTIYPPKWSYRIKEL